MDTVKVIDRVFTRDTSGHYIESGRTEYTARIINDNLVINDKFLPIVYDATWSIRTLKTRIYSHYKPAEFFKAFFDNDVFFSTRLNLCKHVEKYGLPLKEAI